MKINDYKDFNIILRLKDGEIIYCGDDLPDYEIMQKVGLPVAPADAAPEIKRIARYISPFNGGDGVARDVIEQTLKVQGLGWIAMLSGGEFSRGISTDTAPNDHSHSQPPANERSKSLCRKM